jgi:hypothetical protein
MCSNDGSGADESVEEIEAVRCRGGCPDAEEHGEGDEGTGIVMLEARREGGVSDKDEKGLQPFDVLGPGRLVGLLTRFCGDSGFH